MRFGRHLLLALLLATSVVACGDDEPDDEELIEKLIEAVTGKIDAGYVDRALGHVDVARYGLDVRVPRHAGVYDENSAPQLFDAFRKGMKERFLGDTFKLRGLEIEVEGDRAEARFGLITRLGPTSVSMTLRKPGPGVWKIARVHVER